MSIKSALSEFIIVSHKETVGFKNAEEAFNELCRLYEQETKRLQKAFAAFKKIKEIDSGDEPRIKGYYPVLRIKVDHDHINLNPSLSHGAFKEEGVYELVVTDPNSYNHLLDQMKMVAENSPGIVFEVGFSEEEIPLHYAMRDVNFNLDAEKGMTPEKAAVARRIFQRRNPMNIKDYRSSDTPPPETKILLPYNGERVDHAKSQFFYYTRTPLEALQPFVIFSNYAQYVEEFYQYGINSLTHEFNDSADKDQAHAIAVVRTGYPVKFREGITETEELAAIKAATEMKNKKGAQMPSCHILMSDGSGISMINTGVGGPNALNIADLVSVKRSDGWFMAGHAAGLSPTMKVGDYVFADGYFVNPMIPNLQGTGFDYSRVSPVMSPSSSEMQMAIEKNISLYAQKMHNTHPGQMFRRTAVVSTDYRFWERFEVTRDNLRTTNAAALDMETSWLALKAYEQSTPFGAFLKISDLPYHDQPKAPAMTDGFFDEGLGPHLGLIIDTIKTLKAEHYANMHSRKYRPTEGAFVFQ